MLVSKHINSNAIVTSKNGTEIRGTPIYNTMSGANMGLHFFPSKGKILGCTPVVESFVKRLIAEIALHRLIASEDDK